MPQGYSPSVFVSSTCYDLSQIRADLKDFIDSYNFNPVLSDFNSFPVNPNYDTISNCIENVKNRADIFILVVGNRYGSQSNTEKSVTNLEYLEAKAKGIPVYVFVLKSIMNILPIWEKNPTGDFSNTVDSNKLFEFVEFLRETKENWIFQFETAQDIVKTLKIQWSYLFMETLELRKRFTINNFQKYINELSPRALHILVHKPFTWEYVLFAQTLRDEFEKLDNLRHDLKFGIAFENTKSFDNLIDLLDWILNRSGAIKNIAISLSSLINIGLAEAVGEPGASGDPDKIIYISKRFVEGYRRIIEWTLDFKKISYSEEFEKTVDLASRMSLNTIKEIEDFIESIYTEINNAVLKYEKEHEKTTVNILLTLTPPETDELFKEVARLRLKHSI